MYNYIDDPDDLLNEAYIEEAAKFTILPRFKSMCDKYPEYKKYDKLAKDADDICKTYKNIKITDTASLKKTAEICNKICNILFTLYTSSIGVASMFFMINPLVLALLYLSQRIYSWVYEQMTFNAANQNTDKIVNNLYKVRDAANKKKDYDTVKKCEKTIKELEDNKKNYKIKFKKKKTKSMKEYAELVFESVEVL